MIGRKTGLVNIGMSTKTADIVAQREVMSVANIARVMVMLNIDVADGLANGVCVEQVGFNYNVDDVYSILVEFESKQAIANSKLSLKASKP